MRITRSDPRNLVIADFPYLIGVIAFPAAVFMVGSAIVMLARGQHTGDIVGAAIGALLFFFGGAVFTKRSTFDFDLAARTLTWRRRGIFTNIGGVVALDQIRCATVQSCNSGDGDLTYRVALLTQSAGEIALTDSYDGNRELADRVRTAINDALEINLDVNEQIETDILELARAGRKIDAIALTRKRYGYDLTQAKQFVDDLTS
jgi:hypothetical protein